MEKGSSVFERIFFCPGCGNAHGFRTRTWPMPKGLSKEDKKFFANKWIWNNNFELPTLTPSIHVQREIGRNAKNEPIYESICHSFVTAGKIRFLDDCKHDLKGQTVDLPDL